MHLLVTSQVPSDQMGEPSATPCVCACVCVAINRIIITSEQIFFLSLVIIGVLVDSYILWYLENAFSFKCSDLNLF